MLNLCINVLYYCHKFPVDYFLNHLTAIQIFYKLVINAQGGKVNDSRTYS